MRAFLFGIFLCFTAAASQAQSLDINTADLATLASSLPGIGPAKAQAIVSYRQLHGPFENADSLLEVKGIGPSTLQRIAPLLTFGETAVLSPDGVKRQQQEQALRRQLQELLQTQN